MVYQPYYDQNNTEVTGVFTISHDVTEQVLARRNIEESEAKYHTLFNSMDQGFSIIEMILNDEGKPVDYRFIETNPVFETQTGLKKAVNKTAKELVPDLDVSQRPHETENIDLNLKVQRVLEDLELDVEEKKAAIHVDNLPVVKGYGRQLQQLFQNLISNALKYSKAGTPPQINVSANKAFENGNAYHLISIKDNGIGFEQEYADKIFQMFSRLHGKGEYSGTGVGLSIVKKVVENHNGFIRVKSTVGKGSLFQIYLPA